MAEPPISVVEPLTPAWERTRATLFAPFDLMRWLVLGFAAWLAGLGRAGYGFQLQMPGGGWGDWSASVSSDQRLAETGRALREAWQTIAVAGCVAVVLLIALLVVVMIVVGLWVSSRSRFVFLDDVLSGRAEIAEPWGRLGRQGNSLFLFRLLFGLAFLALLGLMAGGTLLAVGGIAGIERLGSVRAVLAVPIVLVLGATVVLCALLAALVGYMLEGFVVPLMHRHDLGVVDGWRRFLAHFRARPWPFLLSGLLLIGLRLAVGVAVAAFGCLTCCLGFLLLMVPYVGTVLLLPVPVFVRSYTVELLAQAEPDLLDPPAGRAPDGPGPA